MATTFTLKRKYFAEADEKKKGMSTAGKVATAALIAAGTFAGARRGMLGNRAMQSTNQLWMKAGNKIGGSIGANMMNSGATKYGTARAKQLNNDLISRYGKNAGLTKEQLQARADKFGARKLDQITGVNTKTAGGVKVNSGTVATTGSQNAMYTGAGKLEGQTSNATFTNMKGNNKKLTNADIENMMAFSDTSYKSTETPSKVYKIRLK